MPMNSSRIAARHSKHCLTENSQNQVPDAEGNLIPASVRQGSARLAGIFSGDQPNHQFIFELTSESPV